MAVPGAAASGDLDHVFRLEPLRAFFHIEGDAVSFMERLDPLRDGLRNDGRKHPRRALAQ